jgi:hypothetical protein
VMASKEGGSRPNFNAQVGVQAGNGLIVAAEVCDEVDDSAQLVPLLDQTKENVGALPEEASADGNYGTGPNLAALEEKGITGYVPCSEEHWETAQPSTGSPDAERPQARMPVTGECAETSGVGQAAVDAPQFPTPPLTPEQWAGLPRNDKRSISKDAFSYDGQADVYRCPMGQGIRERRRYRSGSCSECPYWRECCKSPQSGREVTRDQFEPQRERMRARLATPEGHAGYQIRKETVERRFGLIKHILGVRRFLHRGLEAVRTEWLIICTAVNLQVLLREWARVSLVL